MPNFAELTLPPGQIARATFPRFGLNPFVDRFPSDPDTIALHVSGDVGVPLDVAGALAGLPRVEQQSNFHCVTTWSCVGLRWGGVRFADFHRLVVQPMVGPADDARFVVFRAQDGARSSLPLDDLLAPDVLLADELNGAPLTIAHGAPLRLVAPAHYGYKNLKHVNRIEYWRSDAGFRPVGFRFMTHPRARVALEERGRWVPAPLLRYLYRPFIASTVRDFEAALERYGAAHGRL
jgi:DMSO/TMAO reductase YedYZ molybdopterin-dependent catalytic subunit